MMVWWLLGRCMWLFGGRVRFSGLCSIMVVWWVCCSLKVMFSLVFWCGVI